MPDLTRDNHEVIPVHSFADLSSVANDAITAAQLLDVADLTNTEIYMLSIYPDSAAAHTKTALSANPATNVTWWKQRAHIREHGCHGGACLLTFD